MKNSGTGYLEMTNKAKIFVIYHNLVEVSFSDVFQPLAVGNKDHSNKQYLYDDVGDNISEKNPIYNELTGIYWVFSHLDEFKDVQYIGFSHYRRFFCFKGLNKHAYVRKSYEKSLCDVGEDQVENIFKDFDLIVPRASTYRSVRRHYERSHNKDDLNLVLKCVEELCPQYLESVKEYFDNPKEYLYNMFVFKKADFIRYGEFIFPLLEKFVSLRPNLDRLYISERLTGAFIHSLIKEGKTPLHLPVLFVRSRSLKVARAQIKDNKEKNKQASLFYKYKPLLLCLIPGHLEQFLRRRKAR